MSAAEPWDDSPGWSNNAGGSPAPTGGSSPVGVGDFASVGSYSQGPVTVSATDTQTSFVSALIASDPAGSIYSTSNAGAMPTGWALVDDGSGGLRNVTAPKGVYYVTLWLQWDATTTGWRGVELRTNVERARDSRSGADPLVVSGSWHVSTVAVVANDGDNVLRDLDGVFTYVQSTVAGVTVAFAELDIRKIG